MNVSGLSLNASTSKTTCTLQFSERTLRTTDINLQQYLDSPIKCPSLIITRFLSRRRTGPLKIYHGRHFNSPKKTQKNKKTAETFKPNTRDDEENDRITGEYVNIKYVAIHFHEEGQTYKTDHLYAQTEGRKTKEKPKYRKTNVRKKRTKHIASTL